MRTSSRVSQLLEAPLVEDEQKKPDAWTILATIGEGASGTASNFYSAFNLVNTVINLSLELPNNDETHDISKYIGYAFIVCATAAMYSRYFVMLHHQPNKTQEDDKAPKDSAEQANISAVTSSPTPGATPDGNRDSVRTEPLGGNTPHSKTRKLGNLGSRKSDARSSTKILAVFEEKPALTPTQRVALGADYVTRIGEITGAITASVNLVTKALEENTLSPLNSLLAQSGAMFFSIFLAIGSTRNAYDAMKQYNKADEEQFAGLDEHSREADKWSMLSAAGEFLTSLENTFYLIANLILLSNQAANESPEEEVSGSSLYWGAGASAVFALLAAYPHLKLAIYHQLGIEHGGHHDHSAHSHSSPFQKVTLAADFVSHTGDVMGAIIPGVDTLVKQVGNTSLPLSGKIAYYSVGTLFAGLCAVGQVRACSDAMKAQNEDNGHGAPRLSHHSSAVND